MTDAEIEKARSAEKPYRLTLGSTLQRGIASSRLAIKWKSDIDFIC
jgi:hypothetical protein